MTNPFVEKRKFPRVAKNVPLKMKSDDFDLVTETANISCAGAYCKTNKALAPMTKLKIYLLLPVKKGDKVTTKKISCEGVVVRSEKNSDNDQYNLAIYFSGISQRDQKSLADYIGSSVESKKV